MDVKEAVEWEEDGKKFVLKTDGTVWRKYGKKIYFSYHLPSDTTVARFARELSTSTSVQNVRKLPGLPQLNIFK